MLTPKASQDESRGYSDGRGDDEPCKTLSARTLKAVADLIKSGKARNIVVLTCAGISTAAGIPDFHTPGKGLYSGWRRRAGNIGISRIHQALPHCENTEKAMPMDLAIPSPSVNVKTARQANSAGTILAALAAQKAPATSTPPTQPPYQAPPSYPPSQPPYQAPPPVYPCSQPTASGSLGLRSAAPGAPSNSSLQEAIAKAKAHAANRGVQSFDRLLLSSTTSLPRHQVCHAGDSIE